MRSLFRFSVLALALIACLFTNDKVFAQTSCAETRVIGARGSGQEYQKSDELIDLRSRLEASGFSGLAYEELSNRLAFLSAEDDYIATAVMGSFGAAQVGMQAVFSSSNLGEYRQSVNSGKNLLRKYIEHYQNTDTCLVLVGYSQGAQVVGETVRDMHAEDPNSLKNVIYIGLLGDPEYNPQGYDSTTRPPWLRGDALYPFWGVLGPRSPEYIPHNPQNSQYPFTKVGSWCNYGDVICATNVTHYGAIRDGHGSYITNGIPDMVREISDAIENPDQNVTNAIYPKTTCGPAKQDMVVLLDTSPIMRRNSDLFTDVPNDWDVRKTSSGTRLPYRTTGQMLFDSGCGDKRIAVVGYGRTQDSAPSLLLDFTTNPGDIDALLKSLYQPSNSGIFERTQYREASQLALGVNWRSDASHTIFALTNMPGNAPVNIVWPSAYGIEGFFSDQLGQELIAKSREKDVMFLGAAVPLSYSGFSRPAGAASEGDTSKFLYDMAKATGGYNWVKNYNAYPPVQTFRNIQLDNTIRAAEQLRDASYASIKPIRVKAGQPVTLRVDDPMNLLASAKLRNDSVYYDWRPSCTNLVENPYNLSANFTFTPMTPGKCKAAVRVYAQRTGNGCYSTCPEPFPPYFNRQLVFDLEILPADYTPKIPSDIAHIVKTISDTQVTYTWDAPSYDGTELIYIVRDSEGSVLAATSERKATVTDTAKSDPLLQIQAIGEDGLSRPVSSANTAVVSTIDQRTVETQPGGTGCSTECPPSNGGEPETGGNVLGDVTGSQSKPGLQPTYSSPPGITYVSQDVSVPQLIPTATTPGTAEDSGSIDSSSSSMGKVEAVATVASTAQVGELTLATSDFWDRAVVWLCAVVVFFFSYFTIKRVIKNT